MLSALRKIRRWRILIAVLLIFVGLGPKTATAVCGNAVRDTGEECDDGNAVGGDGCARNCTNETVRTFAIDEELSGGLTQLPSFAIPFSLRGELGVTTGGMGDDGMIPFVITIRDIELQQVPVPGLVCACTYAEVVPDLHGPGNVASGFVDCSGSDAGLAPLFVRFTRDHNVADIDPECMFFGLLEGPQGRHPGVCNGAPQLTQVLGNTEPGSVSLLANLKINLIQDGGTCCRAGVDPGCVDELGEKGPDGIPCTADDPSPDANIVIALPGVTGTIEAGVFDANNILGTQITAGSRCGAFPCAVTSRGAALDCDELLADRSGPITSGVIAFAFPVLDAPPAGDSVVTAKLVPKALTPRPTTIPTVTATETRTHLPTPTTPTRCIGDCNGSGDVTVNELITGVNIALGNAPVSNCPSFDTNADGSVSINELIAAVNNALNGCR